MTPCKLNNLSALNGKTDLLLHEKKDILHLAHISWILKAKPGRNAETSTTVQQTSTARVCCVCDILYNFFEREQSRKKLNGKYRQQSTKQLQYWRSSETV